uniref:Uncharacterized protein n=1 Tax=Glossina pallidipes TaxID=7398 RepID=A0A1A9Z6X4_GLOPL
MECVTKMETLNISITVFGGISSLAVAPRRHRYSIKAAVARYNFVQKQKYLWMPNIALPHCATLSSAFRGCTFSEKHPELLRRSHSLSIAAPPYPEDILNDVVAAHVDAFVTSAVAVDSLMGPVIAASGLSSNNIMNPNLSGSFKDDAIIDGQTINEEEEDECIYEPATTPTISLHPQTSINSTETDSVFIQTPTQGGIAVAALPSGDQSNAVQQSRPRDTYEYYV